MMKSWNPEKMGNFLGMAGSSGFGKTVQLSEAVTSKYTLGFIGKPSAGQTSNRPALVSGYFSFRALSGRENLNSRFET